MLNAHQGGQTANMPASALTGLLGVSRGCYVSKTSQAWRERMHVGVHPMSDEQFFISTIPGSVPGDPFTPPAKWEGGSAEYQELVLSRWGGMWGQRLRFALREARSKTVVIEGPYAEAAAGVLFQLLGFKPKLQLISA